MNSHSAISVSITGCVWSGLHLMPLYSFPSLLCAFLLHYVYLTATVTHYSAVEDLKSKTYNDNVMDLTSRQSVREFEFTHTSFKVIQYYKNSMTRTGTIFWNQEYFNFKLKCIKYVTWTSTKLQPNVA